MEIATFLVTIALAEASISEKIAAQNTSKMAKTPILNLQKTSGPKELLKSSDFVALPSKLENWLGNNSRAFHNKYGDLIIESKDGTRQFRIDLNHPEPHKNQHTHLVEFEIAKGKKIELYNERIFPNDIEPE